ncbi:MAG TPA: DUF559 domain-containing protein [Candidatus Binataceae bacterium]|nr:DUF559 domain-containing protein [Candidatus Binataceae bacterium]
MASKNLRDNARRLRADSTDAEKRLWLRLRAKRFARFKFRRQPPIGPYIVDFCCPVARLIVELDGGQHGASEQQIADRARTQYLNENGYRVLRFWNHLIFEHLNNVLDGIADALKTAAMPSNQ